MSTLRTTDLFPVTRGTSTYKVSYQDILKGVKLPAVMEFKGVVKPTDPVPLATSKLKPGMVYAFSPAGAVHASWVGIAAMSAADGQLAVWEGTKWEMMGVNASLVVPDATETVKGIAELATTAEVTTGTDNKRIVTPAKLKAYVAAHTPNASETVKGKVELATAAETTTGTDKTRAVHPAGLKVELDKKVDLAGDTMTGDLTVPSLNGGQLAGFRNVIINGDLKINQRSVTIAAAAVGKYGPDRWKKVDAGNMTQIVEDVNFVQGAKYILSWKGHAPQVLTAPATGHWTLPNIPITATEIQLEPGTVATPFERRSYGLELALCQRYYEATDVLLSTAAWSSLINMVCWKVTKREAPVVTTYQTAGSGATFSPYAGASNVTGAFQNTASSVATGGYITASCEL